MATCHTIPGVSMTVPASLSARASVTTSTGYQLISSSSHYAFPRLRLTAASGAVVPRVKSLRIRAEEGFVEKVQKAAEEASQQVKDAVSGVSKEADSVSREAKGQGSSLGSQVEDLKDKILGSAQDTGDNLKSKGDQSTGAFGDVQQKLDDVASSIKSGVEDASSSASKSVDDAKSKFQK